LLLANLKRRTGQCIHTLWHCM